MNEPLKGIDRLLSVVARLRGEDGCPWDREQTLLTLKQYLIEESYEVIDAIDDDDPDAHKEELGDVLLQIALHSSIREAEGHFVFDDVANTVADKLIRRHPHVFGDVVAETSSEVIANWEEIKSKEKDGERRSVLAGVPRHLPALQKAQRIQSRAAHVGFDWNHIGDVMAKVEEELEEAREAIANDDIEMTSDEIGDLLFAIVNLCRHRKISAEEALGGTIKKFNRRFCYIEDKVLSMGRELSDCTLEELDGYWDEAKKQNG